MIIYKFWTTWHVVFLNSRARTSARARARARARVRARASARARVRARASARASARARVGAFDRKSRFLQHCMPRLIRPSLLSLL